MSIKLTAARPQERANTLISTTMVVAMIISLALAPSTAADSTAIPNVILIDVQTVPSILLVELASEQALPGQGVTGKITLKNPLHAFYM